MKARRFVIILPVIIIIIIIWLFNLKFISQIRTQTEGLGAPPEISLFTLDSIKKADYKFVPLKNDPFNVLVDTSSPKPAPQLLLRGVVVTDQGSLALMELPDGNVYPMKRGEKYLGVEIRKITPREVTIVYRGKKEILSIWE